MTTAPLVHLTHPYGIVCTPTDIFCTIFNEVEWSSYLFRIDPVTGEFVRHNLYSDYRNGVIALLPNQNLMLASSDRPMEFYRWENNTFTRKGHFHPRIYEYLWVSHHNIIRHSPTGEYFYLIDFSYIRAFRTADLSFMWSIPKANGAALGSFIHPVTGNLFYSDARFDHDTNTHTSYLVEISQGELINDGGIMVRSTILPSGWARLDEASIIASNRSGTKAVLIGSRVNEVIFVDLNTLASRLATNHNIPTSNLNRRFHDFAHGVMSNDNKYVIYDEFGNIMVIDLNLETVTFYETWDFDNIGVGYYNQTITGGNNKIYHADFYDSNIVRMRFDNQGTLGRVSPSPNVGAPLPEGYYVSGNTLWGPPTSILINASKIIHTGEALTKVRQNDNRTMYFDTQQSRWVRGVQGVGRVGPFATTINPLEPFLNINNLFLQISTNGATHLWNSVLDMSTEIQPTSTIPFSRWSEYYSTNLVVNGVPEYHLVSLAEGVHCKYVPNDVTMPQVGGWTVTSIPITTSVTQRDCLATINNQICRLTIETIDRTFTLVNLRRYVPLTGEWQDVAGFSQLPIVLGVNDLASASNMSFSHGNDIYIPALSHKYNVATHSWSLIGHVIPPEFFEKSSVLHNPYTIDRVHNIVYFGMSAVRARTLAYALPGATIPY